MNGSGTVILRLANVTELKITINCDVEERFNYDLMDMLKQIGVM